MIRACEGCVQRGNSVADRVAQRLSLCMNAGSGIGILGTASSGAKRSHSPVRWNLKREY